MDNDYAAMAMVSQNLGYCIFPEILLRDAPYKVVRLDFDEPIKRTVRLGLRSMEEASPATKKFVECATSWIRREWGTGRKKTAS